MARSQSLIDLIGNTPLLRINGLSDLTGCEILGKAEFMNPGGSVKDRAALGIIEEARKSGALKPGGVIVEGTAGNTGIGLTMVGNVLGHRTIIVMPNNQSREKIATLQAYGAELRLIPPVPYKNPDHFVHTSERIAAELNKSLENGAFWAGQFDNLANRRFHEATTGPEIWQQTEGRIDGFVSSVGTGGTLAGISRYLKAKNPAIKIALADPGGSGLYNYFVNGEIKMEGSSISEGIGNSRITRNLEDAPIDLAYKIQDADAIPLLFDLIRHEGLVLGGSSAINLAGAVNLARDLGPGHTIVTMLCDSGLRYQERLFNREFLASKGLHLPAWLDQDNA